MKKSKKHKKHKHKHKRHESSSSPERSPTLPILPIIPKCAIFLNDVPGLKPENAFVVDKKSNKDLWRYGSVSKLHIPRYKTRTYNCLGRPDLSMKERVSKPEKNSKSKSSRYFGKASIRQLRSKGQPVTCPADRKEPVKTSEFMRLPFDVSIEQNEKNNKVIGDYSCLDAATSLYIQGKGQQSSQTETDSSDLVLDEMFHKVADFNLKTRESPHDIKLWLEFVSFQDVVMQDSKSFHNEGVRLRETHQPSRALIDKKMAILDKALEANPASLQLKLAQLELVQDIWEPIKLERAWEDVLFLHPASVDVWQHYLSRQQSRLAHFSFTQQVKNYQRCFSRLTPILEGLVKVREKPEDLEVRMTDLFVQFCSFLHQCGHTERALCCFQAMIEFNLFAPAKHNLSGTVARLSDFQDFWDSGVARFGELGAKGWGQWVPGDQGMEGWADVSLDSQEDAILSNTKVNSKSDKWLQIEALRQEHQWLPWRGPEDACEDPDRLVLSDDVTPCLFRLTNGHACVRMVLLFLRFLGLHSQRLEHFLEKTHGCHGDAKLFSQLSLTSLCQTNSSIAEFFPAFQDKFRWKPCKSLITFIQGILTQTEVYFSGSTRTLVTLLRLDLAVLKCGVSRVSELPPPEKKHVKKIGKGLLRETNNRSNLCVWGEYLRLLWAGGDNVAETATMLDTALTMFMGGGGAVGVRVSDESLNHWVGLSGLCKTYSEMLLNFEPLEHINAEGQRSEASEADKRQVVACLAALVEGRGFKSVKAMDVSPAFILRVRKRFQRKADEVCEHFKSEPNPNVVESIVAVADCFALFELCSCDIRSSTRIYENIRDSIISEDYIGKSKLQKDSLLKALFLSQLAMLTNVIQTSSVSRREMKTLIDQALVDFPSDPQILSAFIRFESSSRVFGRLKKHLMRTLKGPTGAEASLCAVAAEMLRLDTLRKSGYEGVCAAGPVRSVQAVCEQVLGRPDTRHCPLVWEIYLLFEAKYGSAKRAKGLLYRSLQSCPWSKALYLCGVSVFGESEMQDMGDLMVEKELRVRAPPEELELLMAAQEEENGDEEKSGDLKIVDVEDENEIATLKEEIGFKKEAEEIEERFQNVEEESKVVSIKEEIE